jgi:hypothetical protein
MRAKTKTVIKSKKEKLVVHITPEKVLADGGLFDAVVLLCAVFNRKPRRPFVRQATISGVKQLATMLLAQDGDLQELKQLMDKDALKSGDGLSTISQLVKPPKRKKAVRRR